MASKVHATGEKITRHDNTITGGPQPIKTTIYLKETGEPHEVYAVDAREILAAPDSLYRASKEEGKEQPQELTNVTEVVGTHSSTVHRFEDTGAKDTKATGKK